MTALQTIVALTRTECRKLTSRALLWAEVGIFALIVAGLHLALMAALASSRQQSLPPEALEALKASLRWPQGFLGGLAFAGGSGLGGLFAVVLAAALTGQEYTWRTVHLWLSRGVGRGAYLLGKAAVLAAALVVLAVTAFAAGAAATGIYTLQGSGSLPWHALPWGKALTGIGAAALGLAPYAALTVLVAILARSTLTAVGVGLGYNLLVENMAAKVLLLASPQTARFARYLPAMAGESLLKGIAPGTEVSIGVSGASGAAPLLSPGTAALLLAAYTLAGLALAWWAFQRQDITA